MLSKSKLTSKVKDKACRKMHLDDEIMIKFSGKMKQNNSFASMKMRVYCDLVFVVPKYGHKGVSLILRDVSENV